MKRFIKIFAVVIASILLFILLLSLTAKIFEDDIAKIAIKQVSKSIEAPVEIGAININLLRGFPRSTIAFTDLWLTDPKTNTNDTIAGIKRMYVSLNSRAALNGKYVVEKIVMDGLSVNYNIDEDSISNIDFLMSIIPETDSTIESDATSPPLYINLNQVLFKNITCSYFDGSSNTGGKIHIPNIKLKGNILGDNYTAESDGEISITDVKFGDTNIELMKEATLNFNIKYEGDDMSINTFSFISDGIEISAQGNATLTDDIQIDAQIKGAKVDISELSKYIPQDLMDEFGIISTQGLFSFNSNITGIYNDSTMPKVDASFEFQDGTLTTKEYPEIKEFALKGTISNGEMKTNESSSINIESLTVATPKSSFNLKLKAENLDQPKYKISSRGSILIDEFAAFIPDSITESISGRIKWAMGTSGKMPQTIDDDFTDYVMAYTWANLTAQNLNIKIDSTLSIQDFSGELAYHPNNMVIKNLKIKVPEYDVILHNSSADIGFKGSINNTDAMSCAIRNIHIEMEDNIFDFGATLSNLTQPDYTFDGTMKLSLAQLQKFAPDTLITSMGGEVFATLSSAGHLNLDSIETQGTALAFENSSMQLECRNVEVFMPDTLMEVSKLNLNMTMKPDTILISHFSAAYKDLAMGVENTQIINAYNTAILNKKEELKVITSINIGDVDYALFAPFMIEEDTVALETEATASNYTMDIMGDISMNSFNMDNYEVDSTITIKHLHLENLASKFRVTDSTYIADSLEFNAFDGYVNTSVRYDMKPNDNAVVQFRNHIDGMDFKQLLYDMDNFGQADLTHENISGILLSDVNAEATLLGDSIIMDKIKMKGDFTLKDGGIKDFEPLQNIKLLTKANDLDNIRFQTLNTHLFILNGAAYVPKTTIVNSAMDIGFFGMQSIEDDEYEYHIKLKLTEAIKKKNPDMGEQQKKKKKVDLSVDKSDTNVFYEKMDGKVDYGIDNKNSMDLMLKTVRLKERFLNLNFSPKRINYNINNEETDNKSSN